MKEPVICVVQHSSMGVFRSALCGEEGAAEFCAPTTLCSLLSQPAALFVPTAGPCKLRERPKVTPKLLHDKEGTV